ncbi:MAG: helix-turn-helix domain-containing protein [Lachnospiraceae bacterium]|nr:helix-turn-helix domain-containing protein [Lachnospiraceae bacterium]
MAKREVIIEKNNERQTLAEEIGISKKTYYNWQNGTNPIPSTALIKMADLFNVDIDYLLGRTTA